MGPTFLPRGRAPDGGAVVHLIGACCKSHRLRVRSSYSAEALAAARNSTLREPKTGLLTPAQLNNILELCGLSIMAFRTVDSESVCRFLSCKDLKKPTECALVGHFCWVRQMIHRGIVHGVQWCGARDMAAYGHAEGCIDRALLLQ
eukprot:5359671-Pyramimonas_sp.AAC.1